jgi:hypothetical protein
MKRISACAIILFFCVLVLSYSPAPTGNTYGGELFFRNASSYNLYLECDVADNPFAIPFATQFSVEKKDAILQYYQFFVPFADAAQFDEDSALPRNHFKNIRIYDLDTGTLLREINPSEEEIFGLIERKYESPVYTLIIADSLLAGGGL